MTDQPLTVGDVARDWWTLSEFAAHYRLSRDTVRGLIKSKRLYAIAAGPKCWRISEASRLAWERAAGNIGEPKKAKFISSVGLDAARRHGLI